MAFNPSLIDVTPVQAGSGAAPNMLATLGNSLAGVLTAFSPAEKARREREAKNAETQSKLLEQRLKSEEQDYQLKQANEARTAEQYKTSKAKEADELERSKLGFSILSTGMLPEQEQAIKQHDTTFDQTVGPKIAEAGKVLDPAMQQKVANKAYEVSVEKQNPALKQSLNSDQERKNLALKVMGYGGMEHMMELVPDGPGKVKAVYNKDWQKDAKELNKTEEDLRKEAAKKGMENYQNAPMDDVVKHLGKTEKKDTESSTKARTSGIQASNASNKLLTTLKKVDPTWFIPGVPERLQSEERKQFEQAAYEFTEAALRFKSGAAVTPSEVKGSEKIWITQPGDDEGTIKAKEESRKLLVKEMLRTGNIEGDELEGYMAFAQGGPKYEGKKSEAPSSNKKIGKYEILSVE